MLTPHSGAQARHFQPEVPEFLCEETQVLAVKSILQPEMPKQLLLLKDALKAPHRPGTGLAGQARAHTALHKWLTEKVLPNA